MRRNPLNRLLLGVMVVTFAAIPLVPRAAQALPELYAGLGASAARQPNNLSDLGFVMQAGVDSIVAGLGAGLQADVASKTALTAELRYSLLKIPLIRVFAGVSAGLQGFTSSPSGTVGAFAGARFSIGVPYVALQLGGVYADGNVSPKGLLTLGISL
jgi:hypothetical protein